MPQATDELRSLMNLWFGSPVDDGGPHHFLESHGFTCTNWQWQLPTPYHGVSCYEWACILFLHQEWDYGGIAEDNGRRTLCLCKT